MSMKQLTRDSRDFVEYWSEKELVSSLGGNVLKMVQTL